MGSLAPGRGRLPRHRTLSMCWTPLAYCVVTILAPAPDHVFLLYYARPMWSPSPVLWLTPWDLRTSENERLADGRQQPAAKHLSAKGQQSLCPSRATLRILSHAQASLVPISLSCQPVIGKERRNFDNDVASQLAELHNRTTCSRKESSKTLLSSEHSYPFARYKRGTTC